MKKRFLLRAALRLLPPLLLIAFGLALLWSRTQGIEEIPCAKRPGVGEFWIGVR